MKSLCNLLIINYPRSDIQGGTAESSLKVEFWCKKIEIYAFRNIQNIHGKCIFMKNYMCFKFFLYQTFLLMLISLNFWKHPLIWTCSHLGNRLLSKMCPYSSIDSAVWSNCFYFFIPHFIFNCKKWELNYSRNGH